MVCVSLEIPSDDFHFSHDYTFSKVPVGIADPSISSELANYVDGPGLLGVYVVRHATKITKIQPKRAGPTNLDKPRSLQHER